MQEIEENSYTTKLQMPAPKIEFWHDGFLPLAAVLPAAIFTAAVSAQHLPSNRI
jgi:hypothetical protein